MSDSIELAPPPLQNVVPSYPFQEYSDDPNVVAFFNAYNKLAQTYLDWTNETPLAVYTNPNINGQLLDWIANGIYGIARPVFSSQTTRFIAGINALPRNTFAINGKQFIRSGTATPANDDYYKRVLTWWLYVGNGRYFSTNLLRLKVARFLYGVNGTDVTLAQAQTVSIQPQAIPSPIAPVLSYVASGSLEPTMYYVRASYVNSLGETLAGPEASLYVPESNLLVIQSPPAANGAIEWNSYVANVPFLAGLNEYPLNTRALNSAGFSPFVNILTRQNASPIALGTNLTIPATGLVTGATLPAQNTSNPAGNFIITVPPGVSSTYLQQAFESNLLAFPFMFTTTVVIS